MLPAPGYVVLTDQYRTDGYAVTPDRFNALLQKSEDSQTPPKHRGRKYVNSADILSGVRQIAPASRVCEKVAEFRPLKFKNINLARQVLDVILGEKTREKYKE